MKKQYSNTLPEDQQKLLQKIPDSVLYAYFQKELSIILNSIQDGVFITDGEGNVLTMNKASEDLCVYSAEELIGRNVRDLIEEGYFIEKEVSTLPAIKSKKKVHLIQRGIGDKYDVLVTSTPYIENGKVVKVISTERDITQLMKLKEMANKSRDLSLRYEKELQYYREKDVEITKDIVFRSSKMERTVELARKVAEGDVTVLIQGESGVGKEVIAKLIHQSSARKEKPFIKVNCAAIPESLLESELYGYEKGAFTGANDKGRVGIFELADEGTLFLDEIGTIPMHLQSKLLRSIQEREILRIGGSKYIPLNVRIISASNINLKEAVDNKTFREDLYYRINVVPITIEPLRERKDDIIPLAERFLRIFNEKYHTKKTIDSKAWAIFLKYHWPGNVRELENIIERLVVTCKDDIISSDDVEMLSFELDADEINLESIFSYGLRDSIRRYEKRVIADSMQYYSRSQDLANALQIDKSTLTRKMKRLQIRNIYTQE